MPTTESCRRTCTVGTPGGRRSNLPMLQFSAMSLANSKMYGQVEKWIWRGIDFRTIGRATFPQFMMFPNKVVEPCNIALYQKPSVMSEMRQSDLPGALYYTPPVGDIDFVNSG